MRFTKLNLFFVFTHLCGWNISAQYLNSFKDDLFATRTITSPEQVRNQERDAIFRNRNIRTLIPASSSPSITWTDPDFQNVYYHSQTYVNGWDEFPVKKARDERVALLRADQQRSLRVPTAGGGTLDTYEVGNPQNSKFAVIFIHGGGGTKELGYNDWTFGGNFNRLKNLAVNNGGVYYSPTVTHDASGVSAVADLMAQIRRQSPNTKIVVACGSAGGAICSGLSESEEYSKNLSGLMYLGSASAPADIGAAPSTRRRVPTVFAHGSYDSIMSWEDMKKNYDTLNSDPTYPARFYLHHGGVHGTPIRMIDWRESLNWILSQNQRTESGESLESGPPSSTAQ